MSFRDRIKTLFMLDRDTLGSPYTHHLSDVDCREMLDAFFEVYPEVRESLNRESFDVETPLPAPRVMRSEGEIVGMYPTVQMTDDSPWLGRSPADALKAQNDQEVELLQWLQLHHSPSHQVTAERFLKDYVVGDDISHAALTSWLLDHWSPLHGTTVTRLLKDYVVTKRVS